MTSNYKQLGKYIELIDFRNKDSSEPLGLDAIKGISSIYKCFIKTKANLVGVSPGNYKVVKPNQFGFNPNTARMGDKIPIALNSGENDVLVSSIYPTFKIINENELLPEYLMMWFKRPEFNRYARFMSHGSAREIFDFEDMCGVELPVPSIEKQREIVIEYNTIVNRIKLNEQLNQKLVETAQALYKHWFVDFEFPNEKGQPYKSSGGQLVYNEELDQDIPVGWRSSSFKKICSKIGSGSTPRGGKDSYQSHGISLIRSLNVHDFYFLYKNLAHINEVQGRKLDNVVIQEKDILLNITGASVARCTIVPSDVLPARVNQHVSIIRLSEEISTQYYFLCVLCSTDYKGQLLGVSESGSTRQAITKTEIEDLNVLLPIQNIRNLFDDKIKVLFEHREIIASENKLLETTVALINSKMSKVESLKTEQVI